MRWFARKPKVDAAEFCRDFYDRLVFAPRIGDTDPHLVHCRVAQKLVVKADAAFGRVEIAEFASELLALRMEVIGIAWSQWAKPKLSLVQSEFTKSYLANAGRSSLWEQMSYYNKAVARSTTHGDDSESRVGRVHHTFINSMRASMFDSYIKEGYDAEAAARVANRFGSAGKWEKGVTRGFLTTELMVRLKYEPSLAVREDVGFKLAALAEGFYRGTTETLAEVHLTT